jgi:ribosomal-protein-serine acetyltransferase
VDKVFVLSVDPETELRLLEVEHTQRLYSCIQENREHLQRWLSWVAETYSEEDCWKFIFHARRKAELREEFHFGVWRGEQMIGVVGAHSIQWLTRSGEVGYWLSKQAQGEGTMTRSVGSVLRFLFAELRLNRVEIRCASSNLKSQAIPRRLNFRLAGVLREMEPVNGRLENLLIYELLKREWETWSESKEASERADGESYSLHK